MVEIPCLCPTTGSTETVDEGFLPQAHREASIPQPLFKHGSFDQLVRSGFHLLLCPQQLGFEEEPGFLGFVGDKRCVNALPTETVSCRRCHRLSS
jgi:hypothetical protein